MNEQILVNELINCELDLSLPLLKHRWLKKPTSEEFRSQLKDLQKIYIQLKEKHSDLKWLADTELLGELTSEDEKWLKEVWEQLLFVDAQLKVHAVILGDDIFADYSMEHFKAEAARTFADKGVKLGVFMNEQQAYEWLRKEI